MKSESESSYIGWFIASLVVLAVVINSCFLRAPSSVAPQEAYEPPPIAKEIKSQTIQPTVDRSAEQEAKERARLRERILAVGVTNTSGKSSVAALALAEDGKVNRAINVALANRLKSSTIDIQTGFFMPAFVSEGYFSHVFDGASVKLDPLDLTRLVNALLLARQSVDYTSDPSLENIVTATMQLEVLAQSLQAHRENQTWTFRATGVGFDRKAARLMAEERLLTQIAADTNMSLAPFVPTKPNP